MFKKWDKVKIKRCTEWKDDDEWWPWWWYKDYEENGYWILTLNHIDEFSGRRCWFFEEINNGIYEDCFIKVLDKKKEFIKKFYDNKETR